MTVTVLDNQTLLDIAIQVSGKAENFLKIAMLNDLIPTASIIPGTVLSIPEELDIDEEIVNYYTTNNVLPATAPTPALQVVELNCEEKIYECFKD